MQWFPSGAPEPKSPKDEADRIDSAARFLAWKNADIVMLEEMRDRKACEALVSRPALAGRGFRVNVCSDFSPPPSADAQPLQQDAVVSRFPAVDSGFMEWNRRRTPAAPPRGLAWCVLDVEGELWAFVVVHLKSNRIGEWVEDKEAERRTNAAKREESARQLVAFAKANLEVSRLPRVSRALEIEGAPSGTSDTVRTRLPAVFPFPFMARESTRSPRPPQLPRAGAVSVAGFAPRHDARTGVLKNQIAFPPGVCYHLWHRRDSPHANRPRQTARLPRNELHQLPDRALLRRREDRAPSRSTLPDIDARLLPLPPNFWRQPMSNPLLEEIYETREKIWKKCGETLEGLVAYYSQPIPGVKVMRLPAKPRRPRVRPASAARRRKPAANP